jgi:hypothetical protein
LEVFYELHSAADIAEGQLQTIATLSNEQLKDPTSQEIFRLKHLVVNNFRFPRCKFDQIGLRRIFGTGTKLVLIGV